MKNKTMKMAVALLLSATVALLPSCKKNVSVTQETAEITLSKDEVEFNHEASEIYVSLESNVDWTASSESDWVTIDPQTGKAGGKKVKIAVGENKLSKLRSALVRFSAVGAEEYVELIVSQGYKSIDQTSPYLKLDKDAVTFGADASEEYVTLETNLSWKVSKSESWISIDPSEGDAGTRKIKISATKNNLTSDRSGSLTFADIYGKYSFDVVVRQVAAVSVETEDYIDEDGENHGKGIAIDGVVWAPVNCGHKKADIDLNGRLYQWGRRYGIENHSDSKFKAKKGPVSLAIGESKEMEDVYIVASQINGDWLDIRNDALWRNGTSDSPIKTQYDPCPSGWRIPTHNEMKSLITNHSKCVLFEGVKGYWFSGLEAYEESAQAVFFPIIYSLCYYANEVSDGLKLSPGSNPIYWTLDIQDQSGKGGMGGAMTFRENELRMGHFYKIVAGSVRCVKEKSSAKDE